MQIQTRRDLGKYFQSCIDKTSKEDIQVDEEELPLTSLKSYIIESNLKFVNQLNEVKLKDFNIRFLDTKDSTLKIISVNDKHNKKIKFFGDLLDKRFWVFYSLDNSQLTDRFIDTLITQQRSNFDYPWFFNEFMNRIGDLGRNESFSIRFRNEFLKNNGELSEIKRLSMRFWGSDGRKILSQLNEGTNLGKGIALSNMGVKIGDKDSFVNDNINYKGRFTLISGNSINEHFHLVNTIKSFYAKTIQLIESNSISYLVRNDKVRVDGNPLILEFSEEIDDLKFFVDTITSSRIPFRIWGVPEFLSKDFVSINGIDLHTGDKINLEINRNWMKIYLPENSCGNTVARLFANVQHFFDSKTKLLLGDEELK